MIVGIQQRALTARGRVVLGCRRDVVAGCHRGCRARDTDWLQRNHETPGQDEERQQDEARPGHAKAALRG